MFDGDNPHKVLETHFGSHSETPNRRTARPVKLDIIPTKALTRLDFNYCIGL